MHRHDPAQEPEPVVDEGQRRLDRRTDGARSTRMAHRSAPEHGPEPVVPEGEGPTDKVGWVLQYCRPAVELQLREALAEIARLKAQLDSQRRTARLAEGELKSALKVKEGEMATLRAQLKRAIDSKEFCPSCEDKDLYNSVARDLKVRDDEIARLTKLARLDG